MPDEPDNDRWYIVVITEANGEFSAMTVSAGHLTLCTETEADAIVAAWTADPREGGAAHKVEVFHYDGCPIRPPACIAHHDADSDNPPCVCGDVEDEHDSSGCTVEGCDCLGFEPED